MTKRLVERSLLMVALAGAASCTLEGVGTVGRVGQPDDVADMSGQSRQVCDWPQIFMTADHAGRACPAVSGMTKVAEIVQDADWEAEVAANGFLQVHQGPALSSESSLVIPTKAGFTGKANRQTTRYGVSVWRWSPSIDAEDRELVHAFDVSTDFVAVDGAVRPLKDDGNPSSLGFITNGYVQMYGTAISGTSIYSPAVSGQFLRWSLAAGVIQARINPFAGTPVDGDARLTVVSPPMVDDAGNVYYTATAWPLGDHPFGAQPRGSWLIKLRPDDTFQIADWSPDNQVKLGGTPIAGPAVGIPVFADATCEVPFGSRGTPVATGPDSRPQLGLCATQRPALNAPIAYSAVLHRLVGFSYSNNTRGVGYLVEIDPDTLAPIRAASLRDNDLRYACGVRLDPSFPGCDVITAGNTTNIGNDPLFNGRVHLSTPSDIMDNAPSVSPDGKYVTIGVYDGGFAFEPGGYDARSAAVMFRLSDGGFRASNSQFAWEVTPSWYPAPIATTHTAIPTTYDIFQDRNLYSDGHLGVARYDDMFRLKSVGEAPNQLFGDFVDTNISFGAAGDHYGVTEFGVLYLLDANSNIVESLQITPDPIEVLSGQISRNRRGDLIVSYAGRVFVVVKSGTAPALAAAPSSRVRATIEAGRARKRAALGRVVEPPAPTP